MLQKSLISIYNYSSIKTIIGYILGVPILLIFLAFELNRNFNNEYIHPQVSSALCGSYVTAGE